MDMVTENPVLLSQAQAEAIGRLQLIQLVGLEIEKLVNEYREVVEEIEGYERILASDQAVIDIIREDTLEMNEKYGDDRRTEITGDVSEFNMDKLIAQEDVVVTVSHGGYVKRLPMDTYRAAGPRRARHQGHRMQRRRLRRAPLRRQHARLPDVLHQPGPRVRAARVRRA